MNKVLLTALISSILLPVAHSARAGDDINIIVVTNTDVVITADSKKTYVCHNGNTLEIAKEALASHLAHGDIEGRCMKDDVAHPSTTGSGMVDDVATPSTATPSIDYAKYTAADVAKLTLAAIAKLTAAQLAAIPPNAIAAFTKEQIAALTVAAVAGFTKDQISVLKPEAVAGFSKAQIAALNPLSVVAFTKDQMAKLTLAALAGFTAEQTKHLTAEALAVLKTALGVTDDTSTPSTTKPTPTTDYSKYTAADVVKLTLAMIAKLTAVDLAALPPNAVAAFTKAQIAALTPDALVGLSKDQLAALTPDAVSGFTKAQIAALNPLAVAGFTKDQLARIAVAAMAGFKAEQIAHLTATALIGFSAEQIAKITYDALGGFSLEQFKNIRSDALKGLNAANIGGLKQEIIAVYGESLLASLDNAEIVKLTDVDIMWFVINIDIKKVVNVTNITRVLPAGWDVDVKTGQVKVPKGQVKLPTVNTTTTTTTTNVEVAPLPNLNVSLSLGGATSNSSTTTNTTIINQINQTLVNINFPNFTAAQDEDGVIQVKGTGDAAGTDLSFIVDDSSVEQVDDSVPEGVSLDAETGNIVLVTVTKIKVKLLPAPRHLGKLSKMVGKGKVKIGKRGETRLELPDLGKVVVGVFDPVLQVAPTGFKVGITVGDSVVTIVYDDGMMQVMYPSVVSQTTIISARDLLPNKALFGKFKFQTNGTMLYVFENKLHRLTPSINIQVGYTVKRAAPVIQAVDGDTAELITEDGDRQECKIEVLGDAPSSL